MTDGLYVPVRVLYTLGFRRSADRSSRGDSQSFRDCRVDRVFSRRAVKSLVSSCCAPLPLPPFLSHTLSALSFVDYPIAISAHPAVRTMTSTMITTIVLLAVIQAAMCNNSSSPNQVSPNPSKFFPDVKGNLTKIVWAHAVNSQEKLDMALSSADIMMLEADVVLGTLNNTNNNQSIPIMAHPPATESDLSLDEFLNIISKNGTKGIKLDFKTNEAFNNSKPILAKYRSSLKFPVFLNADILSGPVNATTIPLNAKQFLKGANDTIPECTLSIGWTTRYGKELNITEGRYTIKQIQMMINTLTENQVSQSITYPVRAGLVANDIDAIQTLLKNTTSNATLTIWSSEGDFVDAAQLSKLIQMVGIDKVYVDVPESLKSKLNLSAASTMSPAAMMNLAASLVILALTRML